MYETLNRSASKSTPMDASDKTSQSDSTQPPTSLISYARRLLNTRALLIAILALAMGLRFYGLAWDEGFSYTPHPDERAILDRVLGVSPPGLGELGLLLDAEQSPWNPRWFNYGSFSLYVLKFVQILGGPFLDDPNDIRVLGRAVSGIADVITILAIYGIAALAFDRRTGLLAAALTALAVIHIQLSHFFAVDTLQAMLAIAALYFMVRVAREGRMRDSLLAGTLVGLGLATKASQLPIIAPFVIAHLMFAFNLNGLNGLNGNPTTDRFERRLETAFRGIIGGGIVAFIALMVAQPYTLLDWGTFFSHVSEQSEMIRGIRDYPYTRQYADTTPYWYHIRQLAVWGYGLPLGIVAWAGLLYVSLRGMPLKIGAAYLVVGWGLPAAILLVSYSTIAVVAAAGVSLVALLATLPLRSKNTQLEVLLLCWVVPYFLVTGAFHVKFMRYMLPIAPLLTLFGARMLWVLWDSAAPYRRSLRPAVGVLIGLVVAGTAFYALAYVNGVYGQKHTAVRASVWLHAVAPRLYGSVPPKEPLVLKEHWEESLPRLRSDFEYYDLPMYEPDRSAKTALIADMLAEADFLVFFSNRLYGTIPRLPERYPITTEYYRLLFSEQLGYTLAHVQTSYPELFSVGFVDDTLSRPNLPAPWRLQTRILPFHERLDHVLEKVRRLYREQFGTPGIPGSPGLPGTDLPPPPEIRGVTPLVPLNLGYADESFSVYDHPKVLIFANTGRLDSAEIRRRIEEPVSSSDAYLSPRSEPQLGLVYSAKDAAIQQSGGTWTDIIHPGSWTNRLPVLAWLGALELIALVTLPLTFVVFRPLSDRGYLLGKALGILLVGLVVWLLASLQWMAFSRASIGLAIGLMAAVSLGVLAFRWREIADFIRRRWATIAIAELIFLAAFLAFVLVRMANPDLWHPYRGGEKPMDFAYLNAVLRSTIMPPYDPWFGGGYLNYYYWGQFLTAMFIRATAIEPVVAFNLAVPTFFALTAGGVYSIVYNLVRSGGRSVDESMGILGAAPRWSPVLVGLIGVAFVTVLGNLDGAIQVGQGVKNVLSGGSFGEFDFWRSSRMMPPDPPGHEITEFPFFTFLFADLHAHMMVIPFTVLVLGLSLAVVLGGRTSQTSGILAGQGMIQWSKSSLLNVENLRLAILGVAVGSLALLNTWDLPTYVIVAAAAIAFAEFLAHGGLGVMVLIRAGVKTVFMVAVGFVAFLPYHIAGETFYNSVESTTNTTVLWQFLAISGLFVFIIGTFAVDELANGARGQFAALRRRFGRLYNVLDGEDDGPVSIGWLVAVITSALLVGLALTAWFTGVVGSTVPFVFVLAVLLAAVGVGVLLRDRPDGAQLGFVLMLSLVSLSLVVGLDFLRVEGDIDRLNSIFKFYLQVWVMLGIASAYLLWRLFRMQRSFLPRVGYIRQGWKVALVVLVLSAAIYPVLGTQDRLRDRFGGYVTPLTLNGVAFMEGVAFREHSGDLIYLAADYEGIRWLQENVAGSPVVLEAVTPSYRWGGRVSMYTGLPSVIGWQWHQEQQRWGYAYEVGRRIRDVQTIYSTDDVEVALGVMRKYGVRYVYLGHLERIYFPEGMEKFEDGLGGALEKVFDNGETAVYRVRDGV